MINHSLFRSCPIYGARLTGRNKRSFRRLQREPIRLDHRVGQQFFAHFGDAGLRFLLGNAFQSYLHVLAEMHILHLGVTEIVEGVMNRLALGIEYTVF